MQTHMDGDSRLNPQFMDRLKERASDAVARKLSQLTAGKEGEAVLQEWEEDGVTVGKLPDDEQGILRISIGGLPGEFTYCRFRGDRQAAVAMLRKALRALETGERDPTDAP